MFADPGLGCFSVQVSSLLSPGSKDIITLYMRVLPYQ